MEAHTDARGLACGLAKAKCEGDGALHQARPCICRCLWFFLALVFFLATRVFFLSARLPAARRTFFLRGFLLVLVVVRGEVKTPVEGHPSHLDPIYDDLHKSTARVINLCCGRPNRLGRSYVFSFQRKSREPNLGND